MTSSFQAAVEPATSEEPAGIYIHIPFCRSKCHYCAFDSQAEQDPGIISRYLEAVTKQATVMADHPWCRATRFDSLYIGGGTPSVCDPEQLAGLIGRCLERYSFLEKPEITVEMNPDTVTQAGLETMARTGVNRLSLGAQSLSDRLLHSLGRIHTAADVARAVRQARETGFANLSLDLMFGLPTQTETEWRQTLETAIALEPDHFSVYELTVEEGTPFARLLKRGELHLPNEEAVVRMLETGVGMLDRAGYKRYEISNYCRPGFHCRHNINYWENGSYLGLGAGAISCFSGVRLANVTDPLLYMDRVNQNLPVFSEGEGLSLEGRFRETVIMGLRMTAGLSISRLKERFGLTPSGYYGDILENLIRQGLVRQEGDRLRLSARGLMVANRVLAELV